MPELDQTCSPTPSVTARAAQASGTFTLAPEGNAVDVLVANEGATSSYAAPGWREAAGVARRTRAHPTSRRRSAEGHRNDPEPLSSRACAGRIHRFRWVSEDPLEPERDLVSALDLSRPEDVGRMRRDGSQGAGVGPQAPGFVPSRSLLRMILQIHGGPHTNAARASSTSSSGSRARLRHPLHQSRREPGRGEATCRGCAVSGKSGLPRTDGLRRRTAGGGLWTRSGWASRAVATGHDELGRGTRLDSQQHTPSGACRTWCPSPATRISAMRPDAYFPGTPGRSPRAVAHVPMRFMDRVRTPLLIIHAEGDLRCNVEQSEQVFSALRMLRRKTKFVRFPREASHGLSRGGRRICGNYGWRPSATGSTST